MRYYTDIEVRDQELFMKSLYCDICKKEISTPVNGRTVFFIREFDVCEPCKDVIDAKLRPILRKHAPYAADWYEHQVVSLIERGVSTSRP